MLCGLESVFKTSISITTAATALNAAKANDRHSKKNSEIMKINNKDISVKCTIIKWSELFRASSRQAGEAHAMAYFSFHRVTISPHAFACVCLIRSSKRMKDNNNNECIIPCKWPRRHLFCPLVAVNSQKLVPKKIASIFFIVMALALQLNAIECLAQ